MGDGAALPYKPLVRLYARQDGVFAEGRPVGGGSDCIATEIRFANGRISHGQPLDDSMVGGTCCAAHWAADAKTTAGCRVAARLGIQRIDENDHSRDHCLSCWNRNMG